MRITPSFVFQASVHYGLPSVFCALLLGAVSLSAAGISTTPAVTAAAAGSDAVIDSPPSVYFEPDWELALQSSTGEALPMNLIGDSIRMVMNGSPLSASPDTLTALLTCSVSKDSLRLLLVEDSAKAGTYKSRVILIRRANEHEDEKDSENEAATGDANLDCLEPDMLEATYTDTVYGTVRVLSVEIPASISLRGRTAARAGFWNARDGLLRGGDLASRPPEGIACFDIRGVFHGWASQLGSGVWRLPAGNRPAALRLRYPDGSSRLETVINRR